MNARTILLYFKIIFAASLINKFSSRKNKQKTLFSSPRNVDALLTVLIMVKRTQKTFLFVRHVMLRNVFKRTETALNYTMPIENLLIL